MANPEKFLHLFPGLTNDLLARTKFEQVADREFLREEKESGGWSCPALCGLLNIAVSECLVEDEQYLEIGTYFGRSLAGALHANKARAQVIDNFWEGEAVYNAWSQTVNKFDLKDRITLHRQSAELFNDTLPKIGVFFYDGNHDSGHSYEGLKRFEKYLSDSAIIIVDDYDIVGGNAQKVFPGHQLELERPVKIDVDRWLAENKDKATLLGITPWGQKQACIHYHRTQA